MNAIHQQEKTTLVRRFTDRRIDTEPVAAPASPKEEDNIASADLIDKGKIEQSDMASEPLENMAITVPNSSQREEETIFDKESVSLYAVGTATSDQPDGLASSSSIAATQQEKHFKTIFGMAIHLRNGEIARRQTILDTGSALDIISHRVVRSLNIQMLPYEGEMIKPMGGSYLPIGKISFDWHIVGRHRTYTTTFVVLSDTLSEDYDVLLGRGTIDSIGFYEVNDKVWFLENSNEVCLAPSRV